MGGLLDTLNPSAQGNQNAGQAQAAANTGASQIKSTSNDLISQFQKMLSGMSNPAQSAGYAPMTQNPNANAKITPAQIGSVYSGFNPGKTGTMTAGGSAPGTTAAPNTQWKPPNVTAGGGPGSRNAAGWGTVPGGAGSNPSSGINAAGQYNYNGNSGNPSEATSFYPTEAAAQAAWAAKYGGGSATGGTPSGPAYASALGGMRDTPLMR
jgi:hypothetical protein